MRALVTSCVQVSQDSSLRLPHNTKSSYHKLNLLFAWCLHHYSLVCLSNVTSLSTDNVLNVLVPLCTSLSFVWYTIVGNIFWNEVKLHRFRKTFQETKLDTPSSGPTWKLGCQHYTREMRFLWGRSESEVRRSSVLGFLRRCVRMYTAACTLSSFPPQRLPPYQTSLV